MDVLLEVLMQYVQKPTDENIYRPKIRLYLVPNVCYTTHLCLDKHCAKGNLQSLLLS